MDEEFIRMNAISAFEDIMAIGERDTVEIEEGNLVRYMINVERKTPGECPYEVIPKIVDLGDRKEVMKLVKKLIKYWEEKIVDVASIRDHEKEEWSDNDKMMIEGAIDTAREQLLKMKRFIIKRDLGREELKVEAEKEYSKLLSKYHDWRWIFWKEIDFKGELRKKLDKYADDRVVCDVLKELFHEKEARA